MYARCLVLLGHVRMFLWRKVDVVFAPCSLCGLVDVGVPV